MEDLVLVLATISDNAIGSSSIHTHDDDAQLCFVRAACVVDGSRAARVCHAA